MKRVLSFLLILSLSVLSSGCASKDTKDHAGEVVTLTIAGPWSDCDALEKLAVSFTKEYPECNIVYEYIQNYDTNLTKRLSSTEDKIDLFLTSNVQIGSELLPYSLEFSALGDRLDLSNTFPGLLENFKLQSAVAADQDKFYAIPIGAEVRGMFVNLSLLDSLGIEVPTNVIEFLEACDKIAQAGYIPVQGNPGMFGQLFLYPYVCNLVANAKDYEKTYNMINNREEGAYEFFREPMELMYYMVEKGYYNYKYAERELHLFTDTSNEGYAKNFLNIIIDENGNEKVLDGPGQIAFMPSTRSLESVIAKTKEDYHRDVEYEFILSPVGLNGGYAYMSPARSISVNRNSDQIDWTLKFLNYLFEGDHNITFCADMGYIPNTKDAFQLVTKQYNIPESNISHVGQVTFDYDFYRIINDTIIEISKGNNPKYMMQEENGETKMYPFDYYMNNFKERFQS